VGSNNPPPALAQLIWAPWQVKGNFFGGSGASVKYQPSEDDSFHKLPVLKVLGSMFISGDMTPRIEGYEGGGGPACSP